MLPRNLQHNFIILIGILSLCFITPINAAKFSKQDSINFKQIELAAGFANVVYQAETNITEFTRLNNYTVNSLHTIPESQIAYFIATNEPTKTQVISIRGTSNVENSIIDISLKFVTDENSGLRLHQGFSFAAKQLYAELKPLLKKDYEINITGHSLGGAVALILGMYLDLDRYNIGQITTFGQPKVSNISGAKQFKHLTVIRVVTPLDLVPLLPLFDPMDINNLDIYWHSGKEVLLLPGTQYSILEGVNSMLRATGFTQTVPSVENLENHQMAYYIEQLYAKRNASEQVKYEHNFNIFNLFKP